MTHVTCVSYKSCKVKYSQHHSLICKLQPIVFCHFRLCSLWDKGPFHHLASQQHLSALLSVLEVAAGWCPAAGRSPGPWRRAARGHTADTSPCPMRQKMCGAVSFGWDSPKPGLWLVHVPSSKASLNVELGLIPSPLQEFGAEAFFHLKVQLYLSGRCLGKITVSAWLWGQEIGEKLGLGLENST